MPSFDVAELKPSEIYRLMIAAIVPRPIALISTCSPEGIGNLAPFSFFNGVSSDPACLMVAITRLRDGSKKDTLLNIEATREFVVNTVSDPMTAAVNQSSAEYPRGVDELSVVGFSAIPSTKVKPVRVAESPIQLECVLYDQLQIGHGQPGSSTIVIGRIVAVHVADSAYRDGKILLEATQPIARLAGDAYSRLGETFEIPRPARPARETPER